MSAPRTYEVGDASVAIVDPAWQRMRDTLSQALGALDRQSNAIKRTTERLFSLKDVAEARKKVEGIILECHDHVAQIHDSTAMLEKYVRLNPTVKTHAVKLCRDAQWSVENLQALRNGFVVKVTQLEKAGQKDANRRSRKDDEDEMTRQHSEGSELLAEERTAAPLKLDDNISEELQKERTKEMTEIADNLEDIQEIFQHIHTLVGEQGEALEVIDENVTDAEARTRRGAEDLRKARSYQSDARRKWCIFVAALGTFVTLLIIVFLH